MRKFFSSENPYRDLIYISTAVIFILCIVLFKSSFKTSDFTQTEVVVTGAAAASPDSSASNANSEESARPEAEQNKMNLQSFRDLTDSTLEKLPTIRDFKKLTSAQAHHAPGILREAGLALSQIAQALHDNESLAAEAATFYETCYSRSDLPASIRGLCLADHRNIRIKWGDRAEWTSHEARQPAEVLRLAEAIPN